MILPLLLIIDIDISEYLSNRFQIRRGWRVCSGARCAQHHRKYSGTTYICTYIHTHCNSRLNGLHMHVLTRLYLHVLARQRSPFMIYIHTYVHAYIHTYIHTHIHRGDKKYGNFFTCLTPIQKFTIITYDENGLGMRKILFDTRRIKKYLFTSVHCANS
jgi:hypothetical protein